MKNRHILILSFIIFLFQACTVDYTSTDYLEKVLNNLEKIKSAKYELKIEYWPAGDTIPEITQFRYNKEYTNNFDTAIGASYVSLQKRDTSQLAFGYDGNRKADVIIDDKNIIIDSFNVRKLPFRPVRPPFFNWTKSIIKYAIETEDSISMMMTDLGHSVHMVMEVYGNKPLEFFGKAHYYGFPFILDDDCSRYEIWINKSNDLPYKIIRNQPHNISSHECSDIELNTLDIRDFVLADYFQADFAIKPYTLGKRAKKSDFLNKKAPDWVLNDAENNRYALKELQSKILMIQFTSVNCGPCKASIPFIKQLVSEYSKEDFDFVAIEAFAKNPNAINHYLNRNSIGYKFLMSSKSLNMLYHIQSVPVFFILDENRIVREVINGYGASVDNQIRNAIEELI